MLFHIYLTVGMTLSKTPYWFNPNIHNLGNIGLGGKIHAEVAKLATITIDNLRYRGKNIRQEIYNSYNDEKILDLCCGIGISTAPGNIGIDTSNEMLEVAKDKSNILYG